MSKVDSLRSVPASDLNSPEKRPPDWTEAEEALCQIEGGIAVLYGLWDGAAHGGGVDAKQFGQALYFTATSMSRELQRARKALAYRAGGKDLEGGVNV